VVQEHVGPHHFDEEIFPVPGAGHRLGLGPPFRRGRLVAPVTTDGGGTAQGPQEHGVAGARTLEGLSEGARDLLEAFVELPQEERGGGQLGCPAKDNAPSPTELVQHSPGSQGLVEPAQDAAQLAGHVNGVEPL
jgi:hypothetical protein